MLRVPQSFVASLAKALNSAQVPCVLWGHCLLGLHGVPSIVASVDFVIPDDSLEAAKGALRQCDGVIPCPDPLSCHTTSKTRPTQPPVFHAHIDDSEITAGIYRQSETLWFLPPMDHTLLSPRTHDLPPYFALSSDQTVFPPWRPGRGAGVFKSAADAVVAPRAHILLEAYMRIHARDHGKTVGSFGISMIAYMELYVDADGFLDADQLPEPLRTSYREFKAGKRPRQWLLELREALAAAEEDSESGDDDSWN